MKKYLFLILPVLFIQCNPTNKKQSEITTEFEKALLDSIHFDVQILSKIRTFTDSSIYKVNSESDYHVSDENNSDEVKQYNGFSFKAEETKAREIVFTLKEEFLSLGYNLYISEAHFGYESDEVTVLKSFDQFDILRLEETNGINYGIENDSVIKRLSDWNQKYPFQIIGADFDFIEAVFIVTPTDLETFSKELYDFCPDIVDQGTGTIEKLEEEIKNTGILYLWWD